MNANLLKWDDFKIILAIGKTNSLFGAADVSGYSHATIFRRLLDIEERLDNKVFWRNRNGYFPTEIGEKLLYHAARIENEINICQHDINSQDVSLEGSIRVTTTDALLHGMVGAYLTEFLLEHPKIKIEIISTNKVVDLFSRDADVAIRPVDSSNKRVVGRNAGRIQQAMFTHIDNPAPYNEEGKDASYIGPDNEMQYHRYEKWFSDNNFNDQCFIKTNSLMSHYSLLRSGYGCAILPCYLGDSDPLLKRVTDPIDELGSDLWVLTHPDLRGSVKIQALMDFIFNKISGKLSWIDMNRNC